MKIGSLFSGVGGLEMGVQSVIPSTIAWHCEFDDAPSKILAHHWPNVPNLGDITKVDWREVEPVDIITGGSPCQDLSHAGKRAGMRPGTRSGLWASMCDAIDIIRPSLVVWENVRGALSAEATAGDVEQCEFCVGGDGEPHLRALGRVLGDLAELGYDTGWVGIRAADVGAPHGRYRIFVVAHPSGGRGHETVQHDGRGAAESDGRGVPHQRHRLAHGTGPIRSLLRTPTAQLAVNGGSQHPDKRRAGGHGPTLADEVEHLLPTPSASQAGGTAEAHRERKRRSMGRTGPTCTDLGLLVAELPHFGQYAPAIARWEHVLGRPAPAPTEPTGRDGAHRLSAPFVEWMMGLPLGHVTTVPGITRNQQLKALGNGVVPAQCAAAVRYLLRVMEVAA